MEQEEVEAETVDTVGVAAAAGMSECGEEAHVAVCVLRCVLGVMQQPRAPVGRERTNGESASA